MDMSDEIKQACEVLTSAMASQNIGMMVLHGPGGLVVTCRPEMAQRVGSLLASLIGSFTCGCGEVHLEEPLSYEVDNSGVVQ